jgi:hypothetical protein
MPKYFFHLAGDVPARDLLGHECANDKEAEDHGSFIAHRIGTEKPDMVREGRWYTARSMAPAQAANQVRLCAYRSRTIWSAILLLRLSR